MVLRGTRVRRIKRCAICRRTHLTGSRCLEPRLIPCNTGKRPAVGLPSCFKNFLSSLQAEEEEREEESGGEMDGVEAKRSRIEKNVRSEDVLAARHSSREEATRLEPVKMVCCSPKDARLNSPKKQGARLEVVDVSTKKELIIVERAEMARCSPTKGEARWERRLARPVRNGFLERNLREERRISPGVAAWNKDLECYEYETTLPRVSNGHLGKVDSSRLEHFQEDRSDSTESSEGEPDSEEE